MSHSSESLELTELQLQQELRQMFEVDSQKDLETYLVCVQDLQENSWKTNIQNMYRAIHTIKGGCVTVNADGIVEVATVLEDILSQLRYLKDIPSLEDGNLQQMLEEGGEIIASVLGNREEESTIQAKVEYLENLKQKIQANYFENWQEKTQIQIEFAEQGFDLVVLDLEIAVGQLSPEDTVLPEVIELARELIRELKQVGTELELEAGWNELLDRASTLLDNPNAQLWISQWSELLPKLKISALNGGKVVDREIKLPQPENTSLSDELLVQIDSLDEEEITQNSSPTSDSSPEDNQLTEELLAEIDLLDEEEITQNSSPTSDSALEDDRLTDELLAQIDLLDEEEIVQNPSLTSDFALEDDRLTDELLAQIDLLDEEEIAENEKDKLDSTDELSEEVDWLSEAEIAEIDNASPSNNLQKNKSSSFSEKSATFDNNSENIQVPIPITKLDRSAQSIVDTLMTARAMESSYQNLHQDLVRLISIAKDSVQYLTQLRQIQGDYTLLNDLDRQFSQEEDRPSIERYRKGYVTINRLLENNLRLSEIGTEAEQKASETRQRLEKLNRGIIQLKDIVEESRLVKFRNLTFRVRAIVRDLMTRYGKLVNLSVEGEQIELDVGTSRRLEPILLHLIRNAYDHGLENPDERIDRGKTEQGNISLTLQRFGSMYVLELKDDGRGIDSSRIREKAQKLNLPLTNTDTPGELLAVISQSGFSSKSEISEVSGRGVGMDVVAQQVSLLNASWSIETVCDRGTTFKINFPVPHLLVSCLLVKAGKLTFAIPTEKIMTTALWQDLQAFPVDNSRYIYNWEIEDGQQKIPGLSLLKYWDFPFQDTFSHSNSNSNEESSSEIAVYVKPQPNSSGFWLIADKMLGKLELKIQPLPSPLINPKGLMGVGLQTDSSLIPVIEPNSLYELLNTELVATATENSDQKIEPERSSLQESQTILIVDDAALMRRRIEVSLSAYGYTTYTCADGLEAWNWLNLNPQPRLIITDIEMPNMDGFSLIDRCRQQNMNFPIMVISSRLAEEWDFEASRVGANDFLTKGFSTGELIKRVNSLLAVK